jgi:hypothetical protein
MADVATIAGMQDDRDVWIAAVRLASGVGRAPKRCRAGNKVHALIARVETKSEHSPRNDNSRLELSRTSATMRVIDHLTLVHI